MGCNASHQIQSKILQINIKNHDQLKSNMKAMDQFFANSGSFFKSNSQGLSNVDIHTQKLNSEIHSNYDEIKKNSQGLLNAENHSQKLNSEIHYKDRYFIISLQPLPNNNQNQRKKILSKWIHEVVNNSISIAFNYLCEEKIQDYSTKFFVCQNIIRNLIQISYQQQITFNDLHELDEALRKKILPSIQARFPVSLHKTDNFALEKQLKLIDNFDTNENDYILKSKVIFEYRSNGKYQDLIMKFLNELIKLPDYQLADQQPVQSIENKMVQLVYSYITSKKTSSKLTQNDKPINTNPKLNTNPKPKLNSNPKPKLNTRDQIPQAQQSKEQESQEQKSKQNLTIYKRFQQLMTQIFESVYNIDQMKFTKKQEFSNQQANINQKKNINNKQRLIQAIKLEEKYLLMYRDSMINPSEHNKSIIMTKWAEELWKKFQDPQYFMNLVENPHNIFKDEIYPFSLKKKQQIQKMFWQQKKQIKTQTQLIRKINKELQVKILNDTKNNTVSYVSDFQLQEVYFAGRNLSVLRVSLSKYLNRLIHGLATVSKKICDQYLKNQPILLFTTFKIGDLIRCRFKSKETEVLHIYNRLKQISKSNPQMLKIIRLKNRLNEGTKDILINVRFYERITAEIQLAIRSQTSQYLNDSYLIKHTIYELERATFGPISQLCSILYSLNQTQSKIMQKAIDQSLEKRKKELGEQKNKCKHQLHTQKQTQNQMVPYVQTVEHKFRPYSEPFLCDLCFKLITSNQNIIQNSECNQCKIRICSECGLKSLSSKDIKKKVLQSQQLIEQSIDFSFTSQQVEKKIINDITVCGIALYKFSRRKIITAFKYQKIHKRPRLVTCRQNEDPIIHDESWSQFRQQYILWENEKAFKHIFQNIKQDVIYQKCLLPQILKKYCKQQRISINLQQLKLKNKLLLQGVKAYWTNSKYKYKIKNISLQQNQLTNMKDIFQIAPYLTELNIDDNEIDCIQIPQSAKLTTLSIKRNKPLKISNIEKSKLKSLSFGFKMLKQNKQKKMEKDQEDESINLKIPENINVFCKLEKLHVLHNGITKLPQSIGKLKKLRFINLANNYIKKFPQQILKLQKLQNVNLDNNSINQIPQNINDLKQLIQLNLSRNFIKRIPKQIFQLKLLKIFQVASNQIDQIDLSNLNQNNQLSKINLNKNHLTSLSHFRSQHIQVFLADQNKFNQIQSRMYQNLENLTVLSLSKNTFLKSIELEFEFFKKLTKLTMNKCQIKYFKYPQKKFPSLKVLQLEDNLIVQIGENIKNFINLAQLLLEKNPVKKISPELKNLKKLIYLSLNIDQTNNEISAETRNIYNDLKEFSWLKIKGNKTQINKAQTDDTLQMIQSKDQSQTLKQKKE